MIELDKYASIVADYVAGAEASQLSVGDTNTEEALHWVQSFMLLGQRSGNKIIFIGNGGSAAIASHCAIDYLKNGHLSAMSMTDGAALTCLANDLGYENVFSRQIEMHARSGDILIAISSSGESKNILRAVAAAKDMGCRVYTFSGFKPGNALRKMGHINFYIPSESYGVVEIAHLTILHAILDTMSTQEP